jgi:WD40 repeat protein
MKYLGIFLSLWLTACAEVQKSPLLQTEHAAIGTVAAAIATETRLAAVSSLTSGVVVWDLTDRSAKFRLSQQQPTENFISHLAFSQDGAFLLSAESNSFSMWRMSDGQNVGFWSLPESTVRDIAVSNGGNHLLVGQNDGKVQHVTIKSGRRLEFLGHTEKVNSVALSPNGRYALSGGNDLKAYLWDTQSGQIIHTFVHPTRVTKVALDKTGKMAFTSDSQQQATVWDLQTGQPKLQLEMGRGRVFTTVRFSDDGRYLLTGAASRRATIWDITSGKIIEDFMVSPTEGTRPASSVVYDIALTAPNRILTESSSGQAEEWEFNHE